MGCSSRSGARSTRPGAATTWLTTQGTYDAPRRSSAAARVTTRSISSSQAAAMGEQAIEEYCGLGILVNNAGFVRDRMPVNTSEEEWDAVIRLHLKGHFGPLRHAGGYWRTEAKEGRQRAARVINTSSGAGLQGSVGQATYSAAQAGIAGLTLVAAQELGRYGVTVNANSPVVAWLASEEADDVTGRVIEIDGSRITLETGWRHGPVADPEPVYGTSPAGLALADRRPTGLPSFVVRQGRVPRATIPRRAGAGMPPGHRPPSLLSLPLLAALVVTLLASPAVAVEASARQARTTPTSHAVFSKPGQAGVRALVTRDIRRTPRGATIRGVVWEFTSGPLARELVRASHRGVTVRIVVGGIDCHGGAVAALRRGLVRGSFVSCAHDSARGRDVFAGRETNLHQKTWTFAETGGAHWVSIVTSANATAVADQEQYNDAYQSVGDVELFRRLKEVFHAQVRDRPMARPYRRYALGGGESVTFSPWNSPRQTDPVVARIRHLPASGLVIHATYSNWQDRRGVRVAQALADKARKGADVRVLMSRPFSAAVHRVLRRAHVPLQTAWFGPHRYSHLKFMTARYVEGGRVRTRVWTGSENMWSPSRGLDEIVLEIPSRSAYDSYVRFFRDVWSDS